MKAIAVQQPERPLLPTDDPESQGRPLRRNLLAVLLYDGSGRLLGWFALSMAFGAAVYFLSPDPFPARMEVGAGLCAALVLTLLEATRRFGHIFAQQAVLLVVLAGLATGFTAGALRNASTPVTALPASLDRIMVEGWVAGIDPRETGARVRLRVHAMSGVPAAQTPVFVRMTQMRGDPPFPGRFVRCYGALRPPPGPGLAGDYDFARDAHFKALGGVGFVFGSCEPGSLGPADGHEASLALAALRRRVAERVYVASGPEAGGFAAALVSGDRSLMPEADREALRASGLAHLLAISGLHLGLVGGMVYLLVRRSLALWEWFALRVPVQKPAAAAALIVLACYFVISGMSVATQRAFLMAAVFFGAILFDRAALTARSLAFAMILITLVQPETVVTPGFQMSFAATGALIAVFRLLERPPARQVCGARWAWPSSLWRGSRHHLLDRHQRRNDALCAGAFRQGCTAWPDREPHRHAARLAFRRARCSAHSHPLASWCRRYRSRPARQGP